MIWKTHLAIGVAVAVYFAQYSPNPWAFVPIALFASLFPDVDNAFSFLGRKPVFKPVQWTTKHRGIVHSYTLCIFLSLAIAFFYPVLALPFFIGYSFHLVADSFTSQGIKPFWPLKFISKGVIPSGGKVDRTLFFAFVIVDAVLIGTLLYSAL